MAANQSRNATDAQAEELDRPARRFGRPGLVAAIAISAAMLNCGIRPRPRSPPARALRRRACRSSAQRSRFPNLTFNRPVALAYPDDGSDRLFVVEQHTATIQSFPNQRSTSDKQLFLTLPDKINRGNEEGLLGMAFHPKYKENKSFFVYYSADDNGTRHSVVFSIQDFERQSPPGRACE